ncbi:MAG TPA: hypothetical protein VGH22_13290 [Candidatus Binatia bacterium]
MDHEAERNYEPFEGAGYFCERWFELIVAVILGLATLGSAWSAYQSALWGGIQSFRLAEAGGAGRRAGEKAAYANQLRGVDIFLFQSYIRAVSEKNQWLADFFFQRFRPEFKVAAEAWLATRPLENPAAPSSPFIMKEYSIPIDKETQQLREEEAIKFTEARKANEISDNYLLLTVVFGVALFIGGITAAFKERRVRTLMLAMSVVIITATAIFMAFLPLAKK